MSAKRSHKSYNPDEIKIKTAYSGKMMVTYVNSNGSIEALTKEMREMCRFDIKQEFTMKWIDEDGDPCTISSQEELDEAIRLYKLNNDSELKIHVFPCVPSEPGRPCAGEDRNVYRHGARRWKKLYKVNGHDFEAERFNRRTVCAFCFDSIWGLGRQGFKCIACKLLVHKKCHKLVRLPCNTDYVHTDSACNEKKHVALRDLANDKLNSRPQAVNNVESGPDYNPKHYNLNDFELIRVIGRGSYAKVFMVELKKTKVIYAMKVIKKERFTDDEDIDWLQTEKHVFETASNHPFLVGLHSCFQTPSRLIFIIEFIRGGDLMNHMRCQLRLPEDHARFYSAEICIALNFLHSKGIIYRDLKLDNVLLDHEGHIKLTDFGMCKEGIRGGDTASTFCGTPNYIAPEIIRGLEYNFSVDWWALGVLLYEMLVGRSPFEVVGDVDNPDRCTEDYLFQVILDKPIRIPRSLSVRAASILRGFFLKDPTERLGCDPKLGFSEITTHVFFKTIDWDLLEKKEIEPPFKPHLESERDVDNFDAQFTKEAVQLTPDNPYVIKNIDQSEFEGFQYVNPLLMSLEDYV